MIAENEEALEDILRNRLLCSREERNNVRCDVEGVPCTLPSKKTSSVGVFRQIVPVLLTKVRAGVRPKMRHALQRTSMLH